MLKLIGLELRKLRWRGLAIGLVVADTLLAAWFVTTARAEYTDYAEALAGLGSYARVTVIVFAAVLAARMVIDEYRTRTISVLFMYPVPRRRLLVAKLLPIAYVVGAAMLVMGVVLIVGDLVVPLHLEV